MIEMPALPDDAPLAAGEMETLCAFLDYQRGVVVRKVAAISDQDVRKPMTASGLSLLGVVKHLSDVERGWFQIFFAGRDATLFASQDDPEADFRLDEDDTTESIVRAYRSAVEDANRIIEGSDPSALSARSHPRLGSTISLRWIVAHMIEETARHLGHMDVIREMFDGSTGD